MSTQIETNTEELNEILQTVYNLPNRSSGGSSESDIRVEWQLSSGKYPENISADEVSVVLDYEAVVAKLQNGENVTAVMSHKYYYWDENFKFTGTSTATQVLYIPSDDKIAMYFLFIYNPRAEEDVMAFGLVIKVSSTGTVEVSYV